MKTTKNLLLFLLAFLPLPSFAHDFYVDGVYYDMNSDRVSVSVTYRGNYYNDYSNRYSGAVVIPESVTYDGTTYSVTSIGSWAFNRCSGLTSIEIPNSVTRIGNSAFSGCSGLTSVVIGNGVTSIGDEAFRGCSGLTSFVIPNSVTRIGNSAFSGCSGLTSIKVDSDNVKFDSREDCNAILETESNTLIVGCKNTKIPNSVTSIGDYAFSDCSGLASIEIPNSVTSIGNYAFSDCSGLTSIVIGNSVTSINNYTFSGCSGMKKIIWLPNTPPEGYTDVSASQHYVANEQYTGLSNVTVYPYLSSMFEVDGIKYVPVSPSERICDAIDCVYSKNTANIKIGNKVSYRGVEMTVNSIQPYLCYNNDNIMSVEIDYDGDVAAYAFYDCDSVTSVTVKANSIDVSAFEGASSLTELTLAADEVAGKAFYQSATRNAATFDVKVKSVGASAFAEANSLTKLTLEADTIADKAFYQSGYWGATYSIKAKSVGASAFAEVIGLKTLTLEAEKIGNECFKGCTYLANITLHDNLSSIGASAFSSCSILNAIKLPSSLKELKESAFANCSSLKEITIPWSVESIGNNVFKGCRSLADVKIADRETELTLGSNGSSPLFADCPLKTVYIGGNISYPSESKKGYSPFYRNTSLEEVTITDKETEILENEFYGCTGLKRITMGDGVESIGNWAFSGCSSLESFSFGTGLKSIGQEAFSDCTAMTELHSRAATPPVCGDNALDDINKWTCTLYVPQASMSSYQAADQWKEFFFIADGIQSATDNANNAKEAVRYNLGGQRVNGKQRGLNIIKYNDGTIRKVMNQ